MEFVVSKSQLLPELTLMQGIVERKTTQPILATIHLSSEGEGLQVTATDLEVSLRTRCEASIRRPGEVCIQARKLFDVVRSLADGEIQFRRIGDHDLGIECERSKFTLRGLPASDYPALPAAVLKSPVNLPAADLRQMISRVVFAVTVDDPVYSLNGALFSVEGKTFTLVATDGHRLAYVKRDLEISPVKEGIRRVIHRKALMELAKMLGEQGEDEQVSCGEVDNHLVFRFGRAVLSSRFLEKSFPAYEKVLPSFDDHITAVGRTDLIDALRRVALLSSERSRAVRLDISSGKLEISSNSPDLGEASDSLSVDYSGQGVAIGFNARYLLDYLEAVPDARVRLILKDSHTQGLLYPDGDNPYGDRYVIMPMQLRGEEAA